MSSTHRIQRRAHERLHPHEPERLSVAWHVAAAGLLALLMGWVLHHSEAAQRAIVPSAVEASDLVNINTASIDELDGLPGIGPVTAEAILRARPFQSIEDLIHVHGIGPKLMRRLQPLIRVSSTMTNPPRSLRPHEIE
jgi:competence ComEA-like helix-hairpin-helix protein